MQKKKTERLKFQDFNICPFSLHADADADVDADMDARGISRVGMEAHDHQNMQFF